MTDGRSALRLDFMRCPPAFQQLRHATLPVGLRSRRRAELSFLAIPALPTRPERFRLAFHMRRAWRAATALPPSRTSGVARINW